MKAVLIIFTLFTPLSWSFAQEFSFEMCFEDAIGNRDTLILGYDVLGTDSADLSFGELNIINQPLDSIFDVRITNEWFMQVNQNSVGTLHLKKQIIEKQCVSWFSTIGIDIKAKHWPVTASWDSSLFNLPCNNGSVFTSQMPGTWWDVLSPSNLARQELSQVSNIIFNSNNDFSGFPSDYYYISNVNDTISHFWLQFADSTFLTASLIESNIDHVLTIFPNPADQELTFSLKNLNVQMKSIKLYNELGEIIIEFNTNSNIYIINTTLLSGFYIAIIHFTDGSNLMKKVSIL